MSAIRAASGVYPSSPSAVVALITAPQRHPAAVFYIYNRPGAKPSQGVIANWWRQAMMGGANAHYEGIKVFSETDFTEDLKKIDVPTLVMHGDDDQIVPIADSAPRGSARISSASVWTMAALKPGPIS